MLWLDVLVKAQVGNKQMSVMMVSWQNNLRKLYSKWHRITVHSNSFYIKYNKLKYQKILLTFSNFYVFIFQVNFQASLNTTHLLLPGFNKWNKNAEKCKYK